MNTTSTSRLVPNKKRIDILDIFRGFAVFGIFMVNIEIMNCTFVNQDVFSQQWTSTIDHIIVRILQLFFYTKFFPIFSFLFGLGIAMQIINRKERNTYSHSFFIRRMMILFIFGALHIILLWSGDVLHIYAILGLLTSLLIQKSNRFLITTALLLLVFPFYDQIFEFVSTVLNLKLSSSLEVYSSESIIQTIRNESYVSGISLRLSEYLANIPLLFLYLAPIAFSMFLLGLYFGKNKFTHVIEDIAEKIKKPAIIIALVTNTYRLLFLFLLPDYEIYRDEFYRPIFIKVMTLSDIAMGLFYLWLLAWLFRFPIWKKILSPFKYVGRMALTNYIMHSFIGLIIFSSIGFGLYETFSPYQTALLAISTFIFQVIFSKIWLQYFTFGPLEWVWRCFSYKKVLKLRKA